MSEFSSSELQETPAEEQQADDKRAKSKSVYLVPYPKIVFLYPSVLTALAIALWMTFMQGLNAEQPLNEKGLAHSILLTKIFFIVFMLNVVVLSFDFPRTTSLTLFFMVLTFLLALVVVFSQRPEWLPAVGRLFANIQPMANAVFYWCYIAVFVLMFLLVKIAVQFDYWEVRPNELLHHHGVLSDLKRYYAPRMRVDKEINDLFEYSLLRSGRIVLHPTEESKAIVLDNIFSINKKEKQIINLMGAIKVQIRDSSNH